MCVYNSKELKAKVNLYVPMHLHNVDHASHECRCYNALKEYRDESNKQTINIKNNCLFLFFHLNMQISFQMRQIKWILIKMQLINARQFCFYGYCLIY